MSQDQEEMLRLFISEIFDKYDKDKKGVLNIVELCMVFNDMFDSLAVPLRINEQQATQAILLIDPQFKGSATKEQTFRTFKSMIIYNETNPIANQPQPQQMQNPYMMQMTGGYNPMMSQFYGQNQFGNQNMMGQYQQNQYQGQYQGGFNQWPYGNYQNYPR